MVEDDTPVPKSGRISWRRFRTELLIAMPLAVAVGLFALWPVLSAEVKPWEVGRPVPTQSPDESRRIVADTGVSVVLPQNWEHKLVGESLVLFPRQMFAGRNPAQMTFGPSPIGLDRQLTWKGTTFQGRSAERAVHRRISTFDDPAVTVWIYRFPANGCFHEAAYLLAVDREQIPEMALLYLETVTVHPGEEDRSGD